MTAVTYTNRQGKTYYLHQGTTKTGNPKYHFSLKADGNLVESVPAGYEIYENPNAQVFLRRSRTQLVTDDERAVVEDGVRRLTQVPYALVDVKGKAISIHVADQDVDMLVKTLMHLSSDAAQVRAIVERKLTYSPMLRFVLHDARQRQFVCERYSFLGGIDDWIMISDSGPLADLVRSFVPHLGEESFFELY